MSHHSDSRKQPAGSSLPSTARQASADQPVRIKQASREGAALTTGRQHRETSPASIHPSKANKQKGQRGRGRVRMQIKTRTHLCDSYQIQYETANFHSSTEVETPPRLLLNSIPHSIDLLPSIP